MEQVTLKEYEGAVVECIKLARQGTSGGRAAAQALLSAYNGYDFQLNVVDLCFLDQKNYQLVLMVIRGRYETGREPHNMVENGDKIFRELWDQWIRLHVKERGKEECPDCNGHGKLWPNPDDDNDTKECPRCKGKGRICCCGR